MGRVEIHGRRTLLDRFFRVEQVVLSHEHPDGSMSRPLTRLNVDRGDGAAVVLHDPERRVVVLVRQFRFSTWEKGPGWLVELVAGTVPHGRPPEEEVWRALDAGRIADAKTLVGLMWLRRRLFS